jgi:hypothetical protein
MPLLTIDLQEGFVQDHVVIEVDGREIFNDKAVKSRMQIGYAAQAQIDVGTGPHMLRVSMPAARMSREAKVDTTKISHAGVTRDGQDLRIRLSSEPFGYM